MENILFMIGVFVALCSFMAVEFWTRVASIPETMTGIASKKSWAEQKVKLKAVFSTITEADLHYRKGRKEIMFERLGVKLGKTKNELKIIIAAA